MRGTSGTPAACDTAQPPARPARPARRSVIVTCAVTGSIHVPSQSPYLPITPQQIADESIAAWKAGAAVLHLHARDPIDGRPTADPDVFAQFIEPIAAATDAVINITTGGGPGMTLADRLAAPKRFSPEMCSLNMGTINNGYFAAIPKIGEWRHAWERPFLEGTRDGVFRNTFQDIETIITTLHRERGVRFEFECYDVGHLYNLSYLLDQKLYQGPLFLQMIFGILGGIGAELDHLLHMLRTAQRLFGEQIEWSVLAVGRHQLPMGIQNALLGGNVRVGLEDSLTLGGAGGGRLAHSNAEQVGKMTLLLKELGHTIATPAQARERLALKGRAAAA